MKRIVSKFRAARRSMAWSTFLGVFWALIASHAVFILVAHLV